MRLARLDGRGADETEHVFPFFFQGFFAREFTESGGYSKPRLIAMKEGCARVASDALIGVTPGSLPSLRATCAQSRSKSSVMMTWPRAVGSSPASQKARAMLPKPWRTMG